MSGDSLAWHVGVLRTGELATTVPVTDGQWGLVLNDAGTLQFTTVLSDPAVRKLNLYTAAEPCRCFLAVAYTDPDGTETFLEGGPVWTHQYTAHDRKLIVTGAGLWSLFDHRIVLKLLQAGQSPAATALVYSGLSLGTIAKRLVQQAQLATGGDIPVVFPDDESGEGAQTYNGYDMTKLGDALRALAGLQNGPEIQFVPRRRADDPNYIEWAMRAGTTEQPMLTQSGDDLVWDLAAVRSSASGVSVARDGQSMLTRAWVQGSGSEVTTMFGEADSPDLIAAGFPLLEDVDSDHSAEAEAVLQSTLDSYASADVAAAQRPAQTWTFTAQRDDTPRLGAYGIGDWARINVERDYYVPDGEYRSRIVNLSGNTTKQVAVTLAPTVGSI